MTLSNYPSPEEILRRHRKKQRKYAVLIVLVACLPILIGISTTFFSDTQPKPSVPVKSLADSATLANEAASRQRRMDSLQQIIDRLIAKCIVTHDEFKGITFYQHKAIGKYYPNRKTIYAECNSNGFYYLRSNYYSTDWIFHESVQVKIGDDVITSDVVPTFDDMNHQDNDASGVWENVTYGDLGQAIIARIAAQPTKRILVRFQGRHYHEDVELSPRDKTAIKDIYDLARSLGEMRYYQSDLAL